MILDTVHLLHEAGYNVLPNNKSPLKQGWVRPPNAMDGIPAPLSITVNPQDSIIAKVKHNDYETNPYFLQLSQKMATKCLFIFVFFPVLT